MKLYTVYPTKLDFSFIKNCFESEEEREVYIEKVLGRGYKDFDKSMILCKTHEPPELPSLEGYSVEHQALIREQLICDWKQEISSFGWVSYENAKVVERGKDKFAVIGDQAFLLDPEGELNYDDDFKAEVIPVIINGEMIMQLPDEGSSGFLYLMKINKIRGKAYENPEWRTTYRSLSWIYAKELEMTNAQITQNIIEEIEQGKTPLTGF